MSTFLQKRLGVRRGILGHLSVDVPVEETRGSAREYWVGGVRRGLRRRDSGTDRVRGTEERRVGAVFSGTEGQGHVGWGTVQDHKLTSPGGSCRTGESTSKSLCVQDQHETCRTPAVGVEVCEFNSPFEQLKFSNKKNRLRREGV